MIIYAEGAAVLRGPNAQEDFYLAVAEEPYYINPVVTHPVEQDIITITTVGAEVDNNCDLLVLGGGGTTPQYTSLTPAICTVTPQGYCARVADGAGVVSVHMEGLGTRNFSRDFVRKVVSTSSVDFGSFSAGTLGADMVANVAALVAGKTPSYATTKLYTRNNYYTNSPSPNYNGDGANQPNNAVRNPNSIGASLDFSGLSVGTDYAGVFPCSLVSARHVIMAEHVSRQNRVAFLGTDSNYYYADVLGARSVTLTAGSASLDIVVGYLSAAMPAAVTPFKVLPSTFADYLPTSYKYNELPVLSKGFSSGDKWRLHGGLFASTFVLAANSVEIRDFQESPDARFAPWFTPIINGDSSGPCFFVITQGALATPVLLTSYHYPLGGTHYGSTIPHIEAAMNALAASFGDVTTYSLSKATLSAFPTF